MIGFSVPRIYFRNSLLLDNNNNNDTYNQNNNDNNNYEQSQNKVKIYSKVMRDFVGMDDIDDIKKKALLDFSYNLTLHKLDEAYRAVKTINNVTIWENMAQMCIKTKRLDVAEVCLGKYLFLCCFVGIVEVVV